MEEIRDRLNSFSSKEEQTYINDTHINIKIEETSKIIMETNKIGRFVCGVLATYGLVVACGNMKEKIPTVDETLKNLEEIEEGFKHDIYFFQYESCS